jgi:hypothetical protein
MALDQTLMHQLPERPSDRDRTDAELIDEFAQAWKPTAGRKGALADTGPYFRGDVGVKKRALGHKTICESEKQAKP